MGQDTGKDSTMLKINIQNPKSFKAHRSGWGFVMKNLSRYHDSGGILLDDFIDITFGYNRIKNIEKRIIPYKKPWIGILHHPPRICPWYEDSYRYNIDIHNFLNSPEFLTSLEKCKGIIVLSEYLKNYINTNFKQFKDIPIRVIKHPTEASTLEWDFDKFKKSAQLNGLKVLSIGYFLRNMASIYEIKSNRKLDKYLMPSDIRYGLNNLSLEIKYKNLTLDKTTVKILNWQEHEFYDKLLEQSLVFLDMYDTSCNNAIIECIIRKTPLLINKHPAIVEYLGADYPLYYSDLREASSMLNYDMINDAHKYLTFNKENFIYLNSQYFIDDFDIQIRDILDNNNSSNKKLNYSIKNTHIITESTKFQHRYGWPHVTDSLSAYFIETNKKIKKPEQKLYINNFVEYTFKNNRDVKTVTIEGKKHVVSRGYNLFSANNTDIISIDNKYYEWRDGSWQKTAKSVSQILDVHKIKNYKTYPWIGIIHNPVNMPLWFDYGQNIHSLINNIDFTDSIKNCKCIITLSKDLKNGLQKIFIKHNISTPIVDCLHPIPLVQKYFDYDLFLKDKNLLQIGYWLRKMHAIWQLKTSLNKIWLYGDKFASAMIETEHVVNKDYNKIMDKNEIESIKSAISTNQTISIQDVLITQVPKYKYDMMMRSSLVFLDLYGSSANNAIIECLSYATPVLVNKLDSIAEYLGENYPMFYNSIEEASDMCSDNSLILETHNYLLNRYRYLENKLSINSFLSFINKQITKYAKNN